MDPITELTDRLGTLSHDMTEALRAMEESKASDTARWHEADAARTTIAAELADVKAKLDGAQIERDHAKNVADAKALLESIRLPSKAGIIGTGPASRDSVGAPLFGPGYVKGTLIGALMGIRGNPDEYAAAKATLDALGVHHADLPAVSKATLGETDAHGGYVLANNLVDSVVKPSTQNAVYSELLTVRSGVAVRGVDMPLRTGKPARMTVQTWGEKKENLDEAYLAYTATLYTIARIYDLGKQYLRFSAGSAEEDVMDELGKAAALGENYYIIHGAGSTEPLGILTAVAADDPAYTSTFSPAATLVGSVAAGLAKLAGALAARNRTCSAFVLNPTDYWTMAAQGADAAGFYYAPLAGAAGIRPGTLMSPWGIPIYQDTGLTAKTAIAGDWKVAKFFRGSEFRIESSDVAGERWDRNEVGFRGEEEIGFNAGAAVAVGAFQVTKTITA